MFPVLFMNSIKLCNVVDLSQGHKTVAYTGTLYLAAPSSHYVILSLFSQKNKKQKKISLALLSVLHRVQMWLPLCFQGKMHFFW